MSSLAYAALWIFVFTLPWENALGIIPGIGVVTKLTGGLALGSALWVALISGRVRRWTLLHVAALLFVLWAACHLFLFSGAGDRLPFKFFTYVQLFLVLLIVWEVAPSWPRLMGLLTAYVFGAYVAAFATVMLYRRAAGELRRFAAVQSDPNTLAMTLALGLPIAWYLGVTSRRPLLRWACRGYLVIGLAAAALTGSRGGMLATIVALTIVPLTMTKLSPGRLAAAIGVLAISGAFAVTYVPDKIVQRLATTGTEVEDLSLGGRFRIWQAGVDAFAQRPLTGYGPGSWRTAVTPWLGPNPQVAHNSFLSVLVEEGMLGLLFYLTMFVAVFLAVRRLPSLERRFALVLLATLVVAMSPLSWEDQKTVWFILAALLGLARATGAGREAVVSHSRPLRAAPVVRPPMAARPRESLIAPLRNHDRDPTT
jgi:O-antigen ligase